MILSLDLGTKTGWAIGSKENNIMSGTNSFSATRFQGGGMRFMKFRQWLSQLYGDFPRTGFEQIIFEEVRAHAGTDAAHVYGGFLGVLSEWCELKEIPYAGVGVGTIKKFITGKGNASKKDVIEAVEERGYYPKDDNEADAIAILLWSFENGK